MMMEGRVYKVTESVTKHDHIAGAPGLERRINQYICVKTSTGKKVHLLRWEYETFDSLIDFMKNDSSYERDDLWSYLGDCDGSCESYDFDIDEDDLEWMKTGVARPEPDPEDEEDIDDGANKG